jgi:hypothetical protein
MIDAGSALQPSLEARRILPKVVKEASQMGKAIAAKFLTTGGCGHSDLTKMVFQKLPVAFITRVGRMSKIQLIH